MKWMRLRVRTRAEAEDILVSAMEDIGLSGAQIEDHVPLTASEKEQMFVDILPESGEDDGSAVLSFFVEENEEGMLVTEEGAEPCAPEEMKRRMEEVIDGLRAYCDPGEGTVTMDETEDVDWINNWKQYFHQFRIDDILVIPSWEEPEVEDGYVPSLTFHVDPGTAFGTGMHDTTQLCIRQIRKRMKPGCRILDVGTGSGILAILALMLGAGEAVGTDLDPCAPPAIEENLAANGIDPSRMQILLGNLIDDPVIQEKVGRDAYDLVAANILAEVLVPMTPAVVPCMKKGAYFITSGILEGKEGLVADAMKAAGLTVEEITAQGEWRCVVGRK